MSEKEYKIEVSGDYVKISEVESRDYEPDYSASGREAMGYKLDEWPRWGKILLTIPFNIYGTLLRLGSNTAVGLILGIFDLLFGKITLILLALMLTKVIEIEIVGADYLLLFLSLFLWIIDFLGVLFFNRILLFGMKRYKDYVPKY